MEGAAAIKYPVPGEGRPGPGGAPKPKDRITKVTEKIFIMVRVQEHLCTCQQLGLTPLPARLRRS